MPARIQMESTGMLLIHRAYRLMVLLVLLSMITSACSSTPDVSTKPSLYEALGGANGVEKLTADFIREIAADERVKGRYRDSDIGRFHRMMIEQMCMETGGGCTYTGDDMQRTHAGMNINRVEFNAIVEALMRAMDSNRIDQGIQNRLLAIYAPMHDDIVDR